MPGIDDTAESVQGNDEKLEQHRSLNTIGDFSHANQASHEQAVADAREQVLNAYRGNNGAEKTSETDGLAALERVNRLRLPDNELIELTAEWGDVEINQENLERGNRKKWKSEHTRQRDILWEW